MKTFIWKVIWKNQSLYQQHSYSLLAHFEFRSKRYFENLKILQIENNMENGMVKLYELYLETIVLDVIEITE
jgi:hypothetical protein